MMMAPLRACVPLLLAAVLASATPAGAQDRPPPLPTQATYFIEEGGAQGGPFTVAELRARIAAGTLTRDTLVWTSGMTDWQEAAEVAAMAPLFAAVPPKLPTRTAVRPEATPAPVTPDAPKPATTGFDAKTYIVGTWEAEPRAVPVPGIGKGMARGTTIFGADGTVTYEGTLELVMQGFPATQQLYGQGTYAVEAMGTDRVIVRPNMQMTSTLGNQPPAYDTVTAPFTLKVVDKDTVTSDQGTTSRRVGG